MLLLSDLREKPVALLEDRRLETWVKEMPPLFLNDEPIEIFIRKAAIRDRIWEYESDLGPVCK